MRANSRNEISGQRLAPTALETVSSPPVKAGESNYTPAWHPGCERELMMSEADLSYFINNPVFVRYKTRFDLASFKPQKQLKSVYVNERIVEIPFAIYCLSALSKEQEILDLGCTESILPLYLAGLGYQVTGLDYRVYPYFHPNLKFVHGNILELPFEKESFDAVSCISTLEHIGIGFYDRVKKKEGGSPSLPLHLKIETDQKALEEIWRVLKRDGMFVFSVPFGMAQMNRHQRIYDKKALDELFQKFKIEDSRFFKSATDSRHRCNYWEEIDQSLANQVKSEEKTNCVCMLRARKD